MTQRIPFRPPLVPAGANAKVSGSGLRFDASTLNLAAYVAGGLHPPQVAVGPHRAAEPLSSPVGGVHPTLAEAPFGKRHGHPVLQRGAQSEVVVVDVGGAAAGPAAGGVADAAQGAGTAGEQGGVAGQRGEEGEGEGTLALQDALWGAEA